MLLLHTVGARSGQPRVNPLVYVPEGDRIVIIASKGGAEYQQKPSRGIPVVVLERLS